MQSEPGLKLGFGPFPPATHASLFRLLLLLALCRNSSPTAAALLAADEFDYQGASVITRANGGLGWADAWTGNSFVTAGSLSYPHLLNAGHKLTTCACPSGSDSFKCSYRTISSERLPDLFDEGALGKDNTTVWIAFLARVPAGRSTVPGYGGISLYEDDRQELFLGDTGASDVWAFERTGQLQRFSDVRADSKVCFLVYRIAFLRGDEKVDMWINPEPGHSDPPEADIVTSASVRDFRFNRVRFCSAPVSLDFDALRIGTTYADVAPRDIGSEQAASQPSATRGSGNGGILLFLACTGWAVALGLVATWWCLRSSSRKSVSP